MRARVGHRRVVLNLPEVAEILGVSRSSIYRWAKAGIIPTVRLGRRLLVPAKALERLLDDRGSDEEGHSDAPAEVLTVGAQRPSHRPSGPENRREHPRTDLR